MGFLDKLTRIIGKESDNELITYLTGYFTDMGNAKNMGDFHHSGNKAAKDLERLYRGNKVMTWRTWTGRIWAFIGYFRSKEGNMMSVLRKANEVESWYEKLSIYSDNTLIDDEIVGSRWNTKIREAAGKALENIKKLVDPGKVDRVYPRKDAIRFVLDVFCSSKYDLKIYGLPMGVNRLNKKFEQYKEEKKEEKKEEGKKEKKDGESKTAEAHSGCTNKFPILPAKAESLDGGRLYGRNRLGVDLRERICKMFGAKNVKIGTERSSVLLTLTEKKPRERKLVEIRSKYFSEDEA